MFQITIECASREDFEKCGEAVRTVIDRIEKGRPMAGAYRGRIHDGREVHCEIAGQEISAKIAG